MTSLRRRTPVTLNILKPGPTVLRQYPDSSRLQLVVSLETELVVASDVVNAVLAAEGWKTYTIYIFQSSASGSWKEHRVMDT